METSHLVSLWPYYMLITFVVIPLTVLKWQPFGTFLWFVVNRQVISVIYEYFLEIHILFASDSCALTFGPLRLSCVFLANYMPKCQMSSGPNGPIFSCKVVV